MYTDEKQLREDLLLYKAVEKNSSGDEETAIHFRTIKDMLEIQKVQSLLAPNARKRGWNRKNFFDVLDLRLEQALNELEALGITPKTDG